MAKVARLYLRPVVFRLCFTADLAVDPIRHNASLSTQADYLMNFPVYLKKENKFVSLVSLPCKLKRQGNIRTSAAPVQFVAQDSKISFMGRADQQ